MKTKRVETSLKNTQMLQAPMIPTTSADPKVAILRNHSILSDLFIVSHHDSTLVSWAAIMVKDLRELRGLREAGVHELHIARVFLFVFSHLAFIIRNFQKIVDL